MRQTKYTMIRVSRQTQQRLASFRDKLFADYVAGIVDLPDAQAEHVSFDFVINRLIDATIGHRRRARRQRVNRRQAEPGPENGEACIHACDVSSGEADGR